MTQTQKEQQCTRVRAVQDLLHPQDQRIVPEGEVFDYLGPLPSEDVVVKVPKSMRLGIHEQPELPPNGGAPIWTTKGFVDSSNKKLGADGAGVA